MSVSRQNRRASCMRQMKSTQSHKLSYCWAMERYRNWGEYKIIQQPNTTSQYNLQNTHLTHWKWLTDNLRIAELGHSSQNIFQVDMRLTFSETKDVMCVISPSKNGLCGFPLSFPFLRTLFFESEIWQLLRFAHASNYNILEWYSLTLMCQRVTKGDLLNYRRQMSRCLESIILTGAKWYQTLLCGSHVEPATWPNHKAEKPTVGDSCPNEQQIKAVSCGS